MSMSLAHVPYTEAAEPGAVTAARWISWPALFGAVIQWASMIAVLFVQAFTPYNGKTPSAPGEVTILIVAVALPFLVPSFTAFAAVRAAHGRPGGRAVLWTLGPLAVAMSVAMAVAAVDLLLYEEGYEDGTKVVLLVLTFGSAAMFLFSVCASAILWLIPSARRHLADFRPYGREALGRGLLTAAAVMLAVAIVAALITAVLMTFAPRELTDSGDATRLTDSLTWATVVAGVVAVVEIFLLGGVVMTRLSARWLWRAGVYGLGMLVLVLQMPAIVVIGLGVGAVGDESGDDVALTYAWTGIAVFSVGAILQLVALLLVAMPSVSTLVEDDDTADDDQGIGQLPLV